MKAGGSKRRDKKEMSQEKRSNGKEVEGEGRKRIKGRTTKEND